MASWTSDGPAAAAWPTTLPGLPGSAISMVAAAWRSVPPMKRPVVTGADVSTVLVMMMHLSVRYCRDPLIFSLADVRRSVRMERLDGFHAPGLPFAALLLAPLDHGRVRVKQQAGAGVGQFDPVAAGLPDIQEERLVDGVLVRTGLDVDAVFKEDVRGLQDVLAGIGGERHVVEPVAVLEPVVGIHDVVGLVVEVEPPGGVSAVVEPDALTLPPAQRLGYELPVGHHVLGQEIDVVQPPGVDAPAGEGRGLVLQGGFVVRGHVPFGFVIDAQEVPVGVPEGIGGPGSHFTVFPADAQAGGFDGGDPALQCLLAGGPEGGAPDACVGRGGELESV